jgi:hypothetical protein
VAYKTWTQIGYWIYFTLAVLRYRLTPQFAVRSSLGHFFGCFWDGVSFSLALSLSLSLSGASFWSNWNWLG